MTIEDRVKRLLAEAVADEPPLRGAPLEAALRRRARPVLVGAMAVLLVLGAVVALVTVRGRADRPPVGPAPTTSPTSTSVSTDRWESYTDRTHNLRLRYPPDWVVRPRNQEGMVTLAPPEHARRALATSPPFAVTVIAGGGYYLGEVPEPGATWGRLPGGQAFLRYGSGPARPWDVSYSIDWGRDCKGVEPYRCGPHSILFTIFAGSAALWDRYGAVAEAIVRSAKPVTDTRPSYGDRSLPACRSDQWRVIWPKEYGFAGPQRFFLSGGVQYLGGPRCHLRARLELLIERDGRPLPLPGNPSAKTVEGDLPEDGITKDGGSWVMRGGPLFWSFSWDEWCNKGLEGPTLRLSASNGQRLRIGDPAPAATPSPAFRGCQDRGQPSRLAPWP
jgi:hypothetical protein